MKTARKPQRRYKVVKKGSGSKSSQVGSTSRPSGQSFHRGFTNMSPGLDRRLKVFDNLFHKMDIKAIREESIQRKKERIARELNQKKLQQSVKDGLLKIVY